MNDPIKFFVREGTKAFWCSAFDGDECIAGTCIATVSAEEAVQTMAQEMIEGSDGEWSQGKIEVRDQTAEEAEVRTFFVSCELTDLGDGKMQADVIIDEIEGK